MGDFKAAVCVKGNFAARNIRYGNIPLLGFLDIADAVMLNAETESAIIAVRMRATVLVSFFHENPSFLFRMLIKIVPR